MSEHQNSRRKIFAEIRQSVVAIVDGAPFDSAGKMLPPEQLRICGTGFFVEPGLVATAGHVVEQWIVRDATGKMIGVTKEKPWILMQAPVEPESDRVLYLFAPSQWVFRAVRDVAILAIVTQPDAIVGPEPMPDKVPIGTHSPVRLASSHCREGDNIAVCGYPLGTMLHAKEIPSPGIFVPSFSSGIVSALLPHVATLPQSLAVFQIDAMINPGNSGGPVFDTDTGEVIGLVVSSSGFTHDGVLIGDIVPGPGQNAQSSVAVRGVVTIRQPFGLAYAEHSHHLKEIIENAKQ